MKIYICCSKHFYDRVPPIKEELEKQGHEVTLPNSYEEPFQEERMKEQSAEAHIEWKSGMLRNQAIKVGANDALVILNYEKNEQENYIGGATFLEIFKAFELGKKIFLLNPIPKSVFQDELTAINPLILNGDLTEVK